MLPSKNSELNQRSLTTQIQVMFFDTDVGGGVHNIAYLRFVETTRTLLAVQLGLDWKWMQEQSIFPVILKTEIDYHTPALVGDLLDVTVHLGEATGVRFWCHFKIIRPAGGTMIVSGKQALAFVKVPEGKPLRLPKTFPTPFVPELKT
ncbi:MAG: acyl-CoA thioesterase [Verrucomicrobia bacterium]|nr:acyl-CoA thioesterase [Verrucomicrobiota bacterium]